MFSEYASRFLQQSTSHLQASDNARSPLDRRRNNLAPSGSRYVQRPSSGMLNPYQSQNPASSNSRFPFAARLGRQQQAPLFHSTHEDFEEEDEGDEHEREVADFYALQRSRRQFGPSNLTESEELEDDEEGADSVEGQRHDRDEGSQRGREHATTISTWRDQSMPESAASAPSSKGKGRLVDVNLASTINEEPPESLANLASELDPDEPPPPHQTFRLSAKDPRQSSFLMPLETDSETNLLNPRPSSPGAESVPPTVILPTHEPPRHDAFWATLFEISLFAMFASFTLIWFHTSSPKTPLGDSIYSALRGSTDMLLWDTVISIVVALIWLALLRHHVRNLVYLMLLAVPVILFAFSLYPLINSFRGTYNGASVQDRVMRWLSPLPFIFACIWTWSIITHRHSLSRSIKILEFSTKILSASPYLIMLGFVTLGVVVSFTWIWMLMFERIFLSGHFAQSGTGKWILYANSWWLGVFFILQYLWSLGVIAGIQRATTAATVSQWYFHRLAVPQPSSQQVVRASFNHAVGALFGTVCLSTFLSLLVRLPLIILPGRISGILNMCAYWVMPTSLATTTNPLTLTYAAIHSQPLGIASRGLGQLSFVSRTNPSNTLGPRNLNPRDPQSSALIPYRLAKLLLQATKWIMSAALGFGGWVRTARNLRIDGASGGIKGSVYAYVVGLIAGTIGFAVLGAVENVVGAVLDAAVICWASETGGRAEARFCREAGELFGGEDERPGLGREGRVGL
ncbi:hypothetical protein BDY17DRAFT_319410 [Neohortaea acidophila]|uniref:Protein PNS1 n=1 Tax=Neohortaea acidophila TaxID=245834 RepID=A0A6A6PGE9_9PEZI|nr:uncharacterized protein BDY17DRAFT_319410 [Neohortaea acidophila]KAF2478804.1 hypothetical protein BDY17DRAFT_319410 [Neohortaea acidophila]